MKKVALIFDFLLSSLLLLAFAVLAYFAIEPAFIIEDGWCVTLWSFIYWAYGTIFVKDTLPFCKGLLERLCQRRT